MEFLDFGYTTKWIKYGFIDQSVLETQIAEFNNGKEKPLEEFRANLFDKWISAHKSVTNKQIEEFLELAIEDRTPTMAGNAVRKLFTSEIITDDQFTFMAERLPQFGDWALKLITRESLLKRLKNEELSEEIIDDCIQYKIDFEDNRLILNIIRDSEDIEMLLKLTGNRNGKQIRKLASKKIDRIKREQNA